MIVSIVNCYIELLHNQLTRFVSTVTVTQLVASDLIHCIDNY